MWQTSGVAQRAFNQPPRTDHPDAIDPPIDEHDHLAVDPPTDEHDHPATATLKPGPSFSPAVAPTMQLSPAALAATVHHHQHEAQPFWGPDTSTGMIAMADCSRPRWCWNELAMELAAHQFELPAQGVSVAHGEGSPNSLSTV